MVRDVIRLRTQLLPYVYTAFYDYNRQGIPPFRAMVLENEFDSTEILTGGKLDDSDNPYAEQKRIEALGNKLRQFNMLAAPAVILLIAIVLGIKRSMRKRHYISHARAS